MRGSHLLTVANAYFTTSVDTLQDAARPSIARHGFLMARPSLPAIEYEAAKKTKICRSIWVNFVFKYRQSGKMCYNELY